MASSQEKKGHLKLIQNDPWLEPYKEAIRGRYTYALNRESELTNGRKLADFAAGHLYFGLNKTPDGWIFREWAPNASAIYLTGDFSDWKLLDEFRLTNNGKGVWELAIPAGRIHHGQLYKMMVQWNGGGGERIPAYATRVIQDTQTRLFCAQVWDPEKPYTFKNKKFKPETNPLLIYECHIGMAVEEERVGTYTEFRQNILPKVKEDGYNTLQIMAIQEHPYYGSFGYHVSSFFAPSSRFGTPDELKQLIDEAHNMGIAVIMDIVHSHAVKNTLEGLSSIDGTTKLYFKGEHPAWDSLCFNYQKDEVLQFLLSNCRYWLEEFHFDGFRFDGVTSMKCGVGKCGHCTVGKTYVCKDGPVFTYDELLKMPVEY